MVDDIEDVFLCAFYGSVVPITGGDDLFADLDDLGDARRGAAALRPSIFRKKLSDELELEKQS
jgi:hypothetical protein